MIKILNANFHRIFFNKKVLISILIIFLICVISLENQLLNLQHEQDTDVISYFNFVFDVGGFRNLIYFFSGITCSASFYEDASNNYLHNIIIRIGKTKYAISRFIVSGITSVFCTFAGLMIFCIFLSVFAPIYNRYSNDMIFESSYEELCLVYPWGYLMLKSLNISLCCGFFSLLAITVSSYCLDRLLILTCPFWGYYLLSELTELLPDFLNLNMIANSKYMMKQNIELTMSYTFLFWLLLSSLLLKLFLRKR